jgi:hypothetical protein
VQFGCQDYRGRKIFLESGFWKSGKIEKENWCFDMGQGNQIKLWIITEKDNLAGCAVLKHNL